VASVLLPPYPTLGQQRALARAFGCARVVFNDGLRIRQQAHETGRPYVTNGELSARLTAAKATAERAWLNDVSSVVLQQALADLNAAYRNFFASWHPTSTIVGAALIHAIWAEAGERLVAQGHVPKVWGSANRGPA
jgi:uncharacterized phosphosugar-binding protein